MKTICGTYSLISHKWSNFMPNYIIPLLSAYYITLSCTRYFPMLAESTLFDNLPHYYACLGLVCIDLFEIIYCHEHL